MERDKNDDYQGRDARQIHSQPGEKMVLTREELLVLKSCNRDSFYYRCLPLGVAFVGATHVLVTKGVLRPHLTYGSKPKMLGAWFMAYLLGKLSYQGVCRERIMMLEGSPMAEMIRKSGKYASPGAAKDPYGDGDMGVSAGTSRSFGDPVDPATSRPAPTRSTDSDTAPSLYDDLRDQNRQNFQRKQYQPTPRQPSQPPSSSQSPHQAPSSSAPPYDPSSPYPSKHPPLYPPDASNSIRNNDNEIKENAYNPRVKKNMYGDVVD